MLKYDQDDATVIYHVFTCFVYFFPLLGAIISDSWLGKFRTVLYLSIVYAIGQLILSASAAPTFNIPARLVHIISEIIAKAILTLKTGSWIKSIQAI